MKGLFKIAIVLGLVGGAFAAGVFTTQYKVFPHPQIQALTTQLKMSIYPERYRGKWSIGLFSGEQPLDLSAAEPNPNPILAPEAAVGIDSKFVADPFMVTRDQNYYIFYEALNPETRLGEIAYSVSDDLVEWQFGGVALQEPFHLSYPHIIEWNGDYYMTPESATDYAVRLYKADQFPSGWSYVGNLLEGYSLVDPTIFRHADRWWMFVTTGENDVLNLYFSNELEQGWQPHPANPIIKQNKMSARSAGKVLSHEGRLYRFAQDGRQYYGEQVFAFEITELSTEGYAETMVSHNPIVSKSGSGWNAAGMHHVDLHYLDDRWVAIVDGKSRR